MVRHPTMFLQGSFFNLKVMQMMSDMWIDDMCQK